MHGKPFKQPSLVQLLLALLVVIASCGALLRLPELIKYAGAPLLVLPAQLGLVQQPQAAEVLPLATTGTTTVTLLHAGRYAIYAANYELWCRPEEACKLRPRPLISRAVAVQPERELSFIGVERGLRPYDTPFAQGRPVLSFDIDAPGTYRFWTDGEAGTHIAIVPDYTTGHETTILLASAAQLIALGAAVCGVLWFAGRHRRARRQQWAAARTERNEEAETFWQRERERQQRAVPKPPNEPHTS